MECLAKLFLNKRQTLESTLRTCDDVPIRKDKPPNNEMEEGRIPELADCKANLSRVKVLEVFVESQNKKLIDPVDEGKVYDGDEDHDWYSCTIHKSHLCASDDLSQPGVHYKLWSNVELLVVLLSNLSRDLAVSTPSSIIPGSYLAVDDHQNRENVGKNDL